MIDYGEIRKIIEEAIEEEFTSMGVDIVYENTGPYNGVNDHIEIYIEGDIWAADMSGTSMVKGRAIVSIFAVAGSGGNFARDLATRMVDMCQELSGINFQGPFEFVPVGVEDDSSFFKYNLIMPYIYG